MIVYVVQVNDTVVRVCASQELAEREGLAELKATGARVLGAGSLFSEDGSTPPFPARWDKRYVYQGAVGVFVNIHELELMEK